MTWSKSYQHDEHGNAIFGSKRSLLEAVQQGQPVRILMDGKVKAVTSAQTLWVRNGNVYAQNTSHVSASFDGARLRFQKDSFWWMIIVDTQGHRDMIRWNIGEHTMRGHNQDKVSMTWFVAET